MGIPTSATLIDLFFLILCLRTLYIAISRGVLPESFKITGLFIGSLAAFEYYSFFSDKIIRRIPFLNKEYFYFLSFLLILLGLNSIFVLARLIITFLFRKEEAPLKERWVLLLIGGIRVCFLSSVVIFLLHLSPLKPQYFHNSISYYIFKDIAPKTYLVSFKLYNKFNPDAVSSKGVERYLELN